MPTLERYATENPIPYGLVTLSLRHCAFVVPVQQYLQCQINQVLEQAYTTWSWNQTYQGQMWWPLYSGARNELGRRRSHALTLSLALRARSFARHPRGLKQLRPTPATTSSNHSGTSTRLWPTRRVGIELERRAIARGSLALPHSLARDTLRDARSPGSDTYEFFHPSSGMPLRRRSSSRKLNMALLSTSIDGARSDVFDVPGLPLVKVRRLMMSDQVQHPTPNPKSSSDCLSLPTTTAQLDSAAWPSKARPSTLRTRRRPAKTTQSSVSIRTSARTPPVKLESATASSVQSPDRLSLQLVQLEALRRRPSRTTRPVNR